MVRALVFALALPVCALAARADRPAVDPFESLEAHVEQAAESWGAPGLAIAVVHRGAVVLLRGYGVERLGEAAPVTPDTRFAIGSTTKAMTAALAARLVDRGAIGWDDRVIDHLPAFRLLDPWITREVTVRDLLVHRAGLRNADFLWYGRDAAPGEVLEGLARVPTGYSMRSRFLYQNVMVAAAGELTATVAGTTWTELLRRELLEPLGMSRTVPVAAELAGTADLADAASVAVPHDRVDGTLMPIDNASVDAVAPAGSVWSSARDMAAWIRFLLAGGVTPAGERLLTEATVDELFAPQAIVGRDTFYPTARLTEPSWITYGLGWFQHDYRGEKIDFHTGSIDGMSAIVGLLRAHDLGVVVLINRDHCELRHALMYHVFDRALEAPARDWSNQLLELYAGLEEAAEQARTEAEAKRVQGTRPSLDPERYAGRYDDPLYGPLEVRSVDGGLRLRLGEGLEGPLEHWHHDTFRVRFDARWRGSVLVTFQLDASGEVAEAMIGGVRRARVADDGGRAAE